MRVRILLYFLTLVVSTSNSYAAPQPGGTLDPAPLVDEDDPQLKKIPAQLRSFEAEPTSYLGIGFGYAGGPYLERDTYSQGLMGSLRYMPFEPDELPSWDYQVQVSQAQFIGLGAGYRLYCCSTDPFLPYLRLGAQIYVDGKSEMAGFVAIRRWRAHAGVGIGEIFNSEFGLGLAVTGVDLYALFSYNWAL